MSNPLQCLGGGVHAIGQHTPLSSKMHHPLHSKLLHPRCSKPRTPQQLVDSPQQGRRFTPQPRLRTARNTGGKEVQKGSSTGSATPETTGIQGSCSRQHRRQNPSTHGPVKEQTQACAQGRVQRQRPSNGYGEAKPVVCKLADVPHHAMNKQVHIIPSYHQSSRMESAKGRKSHVMCIM